MQFNGILAIFLSFHCIFRIDGAIDAKYFQLIANQPDVEDAAISTASKVEYLAHPAEKFKFLREMNINKSSREVKITFCEEVIQTDYYGFEFDLADYADPSNELYDFGLRYAATDANSRRGQLWMFRCPSIVYVDRETDTQQLLKTEYIYRVSTGKTSDSALVFFQATLASPAYPVLHVVDIDFVKLQNREQRSSLASTPPEMNLDVDLASVEEVTIAYLKFKRNSMPYQKFTQAFVSLNICGLRRSTKIHACRLTLQKMFAYLDLDTEDYDQDVCNRERIHFSVKNEANRRRNNELAVVRCPPARFKYTRKNVKHPIIFYLSSNLVGASVTILSESNEKGVKLTHECVAENLDVMSIAKELRRLRFMLYSREQQQRRDAGRLYREVEAKVNSKMGTVQMPATIAKIEDVQRELLAEPAEPLHVIHQRWMVDDFIIAYSAVRKQKLVYRRFREMHRSIDVCQLSCSQRQILCKKILESPEYAFELKRSDKNDYPCARHKISLTSRQAKYLATDVFLTWRCQPSRYHPESVYYVGKSHLKDAVFLYRFYNLDKIRFKAGTIYPDALATKINRFQLLQSSQPN